MLIYNLTIHTWYSLCHLELQVLQNSVELPREHGYVTAQILAHHTPHYRERTWYISGPPGMVNAYQKLLRKAGVPRRQIKTDFFPGVA